MPTYLLEFCRDPLSDTTPTYIDITNYMLEGSYQRDGGGDLDDPQAGTATITLDNRDRRFEPTYAAGAYYPDIKPLRRMRLSIDGDTEFSGFVASWGPQWPDGLFNQEAVVTLVDGQHLAELEALPGLDPPDATSWEEVVAFDEPWGHWRLGEEAGTRLATQVRKAKKKLLVGSHVYTRSYKQKYKRKVTKSQAEAVVGPSGTYKGLPTLGQPGAILGDTDCSVRFDGVNDYARIGPLDEDDMLKRNKVSVEAWVNTDTVSTFTRPIVSGPYLASVTNNCFMLWAANSPFTPAFTIVSSSGLQDSANGTTPLVPGTWYHLVGTWDGSTVSLYVNGVLEGQASSSLTMATGLVSDYIRIAASDDSGTLQWDGYIDEVAIYEKALSPERVLAHYYAGALRGWNEMTAGSRIADILTHDLWATGSVQTTGLNVQPQMKIGQTMMEELQQTWESEKPSRTFYFSGAGNPVYLGWNFGDASPYNTVQVTFGDGASEVPYEDLAVEYTEQDIYNEVSISRDGGDVQLASDSDSQDEFRLRRYQQSGLLLSKDSDAGTIADTILESFRQPELIVTGMTIRGEDSTALAEIKAREPGQLVRVKRRPKGGTAIDRVCRIKSKSVTIPRGGKNVYPVATFTFTRGFNAATTTWHLGVIGFSELGTGSVLA